MDHPPFSTPKTNVWPGPPLPTPGGWSTTSPFGGDSIYKLKINQSATLLTKAIKPTNINDAYDLLLNNLSTTELIFDKHRLNALSILHRDPTKLETYKLVGTITVSFNTNANAEQYIQFEMYLDPSHANSAMSRFSKAFAILNESDFVVKTNKKTVTDTATPCGHLEEPIKMLRDQLDPIFDFRDSVETKDVRLAYSIPDTGGRGFLYEKTIAKLDSKRFVFSDKTNHVSKILLKNPDTNPFVIGVIVVTALPDENGINTNITINGVVNVSYIEEFTKHVNDVFSITQPEVTKEDKPLKRTTGYIRVGTTDHNGIRWDTDKPPAGAVIYVKN